MCGWLRLGFKPPSDCLVAAPHARMALEVSHRTYVFEVGRIALSGESRALAEDLRIKRAYLGA